MDNVESRARRGKSWRKIPVALRLTEVRYLVNRIWNGGEGRDIGLVYSTELQCVGNEEVLEE
jgi:hypothetical protein